MSETLVLAPETTLAPLTGEAASGAVEEILALEALYGLPASDYISEDASAAPISLEAQPSTQPEVEESRKRVAGEAYSHSTLLIREVGALALRGELATEEGQAKLAYLRECWESSIIEMLQTDHQFRKILQITRKRTYQVVNERVIATDGVTDMESIALDGEQSALVEAAADERMVPLAIRAGADKRRARKVASLKPGQSVASWTVYPKREMAEYGTDFYDSLGFREGLSFDQGYSRVDETTLAAAAYSVDFVDPDVIREVWEEFGGHIPANESTNIWLDYDIVFDGGAEELYDFMECVRTRVYEKNGDTTKRYAVDDFIAANKDVCDQLFAVYLDLTVARQNGKKTAFLQAFVEGLLENPVHLHADLLSQLRNIRGNGVLSKEDVARLEELNRYATVEYLREALAFLGTATPAKAGVIVAPAGIAVSPELYMAKSLAQNVNKGLKNRRTYGGCTRSSDLFEDGTDTTGDDSDRGNRPSTSEDGDSGEVCDYRHTGCYCCPYDSEGRPLVKPVEVVARRGLDGVARCLRMNCGAKLGANGDVISRGEIYARAQARKLTIEGIKKSDLVLAA